MKKNNDMLASELRVIRHRLGLTQKEMARAIGFSGSRHYQYLEAGAKRINPRIAALVKNLEENLEE